jgi:hypothetical protein
MRNTKTKSEKSKWEVAEKKTGPQRKSPYGPSFYTKKQFLKIILHLHH